MVEVNWDQLGVPSNAYAYLIAMGNQQLNNRVMDLNGGRYYSIAPDLLDSWEDMRRIMLGNYTDIHGWYPNLKWLADAYGEIGVPTILGNERHTLDYARHMEWIRFCEQEERPVVDPDLQTTESTLFRTDYLEASDRVARNAILGFPEQKPHPFGLRNTSWFNANINQYHRKAHALYATHALPGLVEMIKRLNLWCSYNRMTFSLRPLIAMPSHFHNELITTPAGIQIIEDRFRTTANNITAKFLESLAVFNGHPQDNTILDTHRRWFYRNANAMISSDSDEEGIALTFSGMPPILFKSPGPAPMMYIHEFESFLPADMLVYARELGDERIYPGISLDGFAVAAQLMMCIAAGVSILASTIDMGKGHRKPTWVHTLLTVEMVRMLTRWQYRLLHTARARNFGGK